MHQKLVWKTQSELAKSAICQGPNMPPPPVELTMCHLERMNLLLMNLRAHSSSRLQQTGWGKHLEGGLHGRFQQFFTMESKLDAHIKRASKSIVRGSWKSPSSTGVGMAGTRGCKDWRRHFISAVSEEREATVFSPKMFRRFSLCPWCASCCWRTVLLNVQWGWTLLSEANGWVGV